MAYTATEFDVGVLSAALAETNQDLNNLRERADRYERVLRNIVSIDAPGSLIVESGRLSSIMTLAYRALDLPTHYWAPSSRHFTDLFSLEELDAEISAGNVRPQVHPDLPYTIYNYTEKCVYDRAWNEVTRTCRGLIVDEHGWIVARPFPKFFNYGEPGADELDMNAAASVTDKLDGSMGVCFPTPDGYAIATRGSFTSEQAVRGTKILREKYADFEPLPGYTYIFEIIYPENRIVVSYGNIEDLFLLGAVNIATGRIVSPHLDNRWPGPKTTTFEAQTLAEALAMPPRPNAEGLVVRQKQPQAMVKIKQADYLRMHAIVSRTSPRVLWEFLAVNACRDLIEKPKHWGSRLGIDPARAESIVNIGPEWMTHLVEGVPSEFHDWLRTTVLDLQVKYEQLLLDLIYAATELQAKHPNDRKAIALEIKGHPHAGAIFQLIDGKGIKTYCWKQVYPEASKPWSTRSEDAA